MKIFKDSTLKEEVIDLDFGITLAGETKEIIYYLYNETEADVVDIKASVESPEVDIKSYPNALKSATSAPITFAYSPSISIKRGLKTPLSLKYFELYM
jgi:hypothetical protein